MMIRLTLPDGTRTQLDASEITDVEPIAGGSLVHRVVGEPMKVLQDARTIQTRINAELDAAAADLEEAPIEDARVALAIAAAEPSPVIEPIQELIVDPITRMHRLKRLMQGRVSVMALMIGQMK
jgi:hypothetical protein